MIHADADDLKVFCILHKRYRRGFQYMDTTKQQKVKEKKILHDIKQMFIPPMWSEVRISKKRDAHLQAYGYDAKERRQYIYHEEWSRKQQIKKFNKLKKFGKELPYMRKYCLAQMKQKKWTKETVLSLIILTLDHCGRRVGNRQYTEQNNTYGLTTLRRQHINLPYNNTC